MSFQLGVSIVLLALAAFLAGVDALLGVAKSANAGLVAGAIALGLLASVLDAYRSRLLLEKGAEQTIEYVKKTGAPHFVSAGGGLASVMLDRMFMTMHHGATKSLGRGLLLFSKILEFILKGVAALCGLLLVIGSVFGIGFHVWLGLWVILSALGLWLMYKLSDVFGAVVSIASFSIPVYSFRDFSGKNQKLILAVAAAGVAAWLLAALQWWALFFAFGKGVSAVAVFLVFALATVFALLPVTSKGLGLVELVGMLALLPLGVPFAVSLAGMLVWEATRLFGDSVIGVLTEKSELKRYR
jgi:uncharacterized membrane protein YbhN (UPF0104 family)